MLDGVLPVRENEEVTRRAFATRYATRDPRGDRRRVERENLFVPATRRAQGVAVHPIGLPRLLHREHRPERRLHIRCSHGQHSPKVLIHKVADGPYRPKVLRQRQHRPTLRDALLHEVVHLDVGPPKAVDALLRVADHEETAGARQHLAPVVPLHWIAGQEQADLRLNRVGVLKLVHQEMLPSRA